MPLTTSKNAVLANLRTMSESEFFSTDDIDNVFIPASVSYIEKLLTLNSMSFDTLENSDRTIIESAAAALAAYFVLNAPLPRDYKDENFSVKNHSVKEAQDSLIKMVTAFLKCVGVPIARKPRIEILTYE